MNRNIKPRQEQLAARRMIVEMIEAAIAVSIQKGRHSLVKGCNCIACTDRRKRILRQTEANWNYKL